jgi:hypothetical protein
LGERTSVNIGASYTESTYDISGASGLSDYTNSSANISLQHQLTDRSSLQAVLGETAYRSDSSKYDTTSIQLGLDYMFSETFSVNLLLGPSYTKSRVAGNGGKDIYSVGKLITLGFSKEFDLTELSGEFNTSESAGGEGKLTKSTSATLSLQHKISDRTLFGLSGSVRKNESGGGITDSSSDRTYVNFTPKLSWKASPWWTISGSYNYQRSENTSLDQGAAESNAIYISMEYVWPKESR